MEPESTEEASTTTTTKQETSSESDAQRQLDPQTNETSREPVKTPSNDDDDDDKTEPASDDFAKDCSSFESAEKNTENRSPDLNEENAREPTDLSLKNKQQEVAVSSKEEEEDRNVRSFRLDSNETTAKLHVDHRQKVHEGSLLRPTDRKPVQGTGNSIDFAALGIILNNNNIEQAIIHQLLNSRNVTMGNGDQLQAKKKRVRSRKRRSDTTGSPGTGSASGPAEIAGSGSGLLPDSSSSPPVVLDVVCGQNQASLCLDKLRSGSKTACVLLNGTWLTPNQYQHVSGRGTARDWKRSIKHNGTSLKALLASKVLTFDPPQCRCNLCVAVTTYSKENAKLAGSSADQENQPPRGVDCTSAGNGKSTSGLRIPMEVLPTTGAVVRESSENATKEAVDEDDDDDEEEDDEEEEGQEEEEEEESMADENEVDAEEEEDWTRKRALMQALALMELPSATPAAAAEAAASDQVSRKRKSVQSDVRAIKKKKSDKVSSSSSPAEAAGGGGGGSGGRSEVQGGGGASGAASSSKSLETTDPVASVSPSVGLGLSLTSPSSAVLANASSADSAKSTQSRITQSFQKEETLTHIIHELRNYKKSLEEKIVAGRRCSSSQDAKDSNNSSVSRAIHQNKNTTNNSASRANNNNNNWSTPTSTTGHQRRTDDCGRTTEGRKADWPALKSSSATRTEGSVDEKQQLPDLVRSHNPSTVTATSSHAGGGGGGGGLSALTPKTYSLYATHPLSPACLSSTCHYGPQARYVVDPQNGTKYECDEFGAVDLRVGKKTAGASLPFYVACSRVMGKMNVDCCGGGDSDGERVLDLSVSSKVKVDVKLATTEERVPKRKRLSDGHSRRAVKKQTWPASAGKMLAWSVVDVVKFINEVPGCTAYAETFKQFGVTGASLVCLSIDQMTAILRMRFDAAQALRSAIDRLLNAPPREQGGGGGGGGAATAAVAAVAAAAAAAAAASRR